MKNMTKLICAFLIWGYSAVISAEVYIQTGGIWSDTRYTNGMNLESEFGVTYGIGYRLAFKNWNWLSLEANFSNLDDQQFGSSDIQQINILASERSRDAFSDEDDEPLESISRNANYYELISIMARWPIISKGFIYGRLGTGFESADVVMVIEGQKVKLNLNDSLYDSSNSVFYTLGFEYELPKNFLVKSELAYIKGEYDEVTSMASLKIGYHFGQGY